MIAPTVFYHPPTGLEYLDCNAQPVAEPLLPRLRYAVEFADLNESIHTAIALQAYLDDAVRKMDAAPHSRTLGEAVFWAASALRKVREF